MPLMSDVADSASDLSRGLQRRLPEGEYNTVEDEKIFRQKLNQAGFREPAKYRRPYETGI